MSNRPIASASLATSEMRLSPSALEALVSGIAQYPDPLLVTILDAATHPIALHQAAVELDRRIPVGPLARAARVARPTSVQHLMAEPAALCVLDEHLLFTAKLGVAFRIQPDDVWAAIARVRALYDAAPDAVEGTVESAIIARLCDDPVVVAEIEQCEVDAEVVAVVSYGDGSSVTIGGESNDGAAAADGGAVWATDGTTTVAGAAGTGTVTGPAGGTTTATGGVIAGKTTVGDTTYGGVAGAGTVTGPNGTTVAGAGIATGQVTKTENGANWSSTAVGGVTNVDTGAYGVGAHSGSGSVEQNSDGSVDWERDATNAGTGTYGSGTTHHHGEAHVTGDGNGSYDGATTIDSTAGSVSTQTHASDGQLSTTVTNGQGSATTYTAGDGQIENGKAASSRATRGGATTDSSRSAFTGTARSNPSSFGSRDYGDVSADRVAQANRGASESFARLTRNTNSAAKHATAAERPTPPSLGGSRKSGPPKGGGMKKPGGRGGRR